MKQILTNRTIYLCWVVSPKPVKLGRKNVKNTNSPIFHGIQSCSVFLCKKVKRAQFCCSEIVCSFVQQ